MATLKLDPKEVTALMRALLRSLEKTPYTEQRMHKALYEKLAAAYAGGLPKKLRGAVGRAIDVLIGR